MHYMLANMGQEHDNSDNSLLKSSIPDADSSDSDSENIQRITPEELLDSKTCAAKYRKGRSPRSKVVVTLGCIFEFLALCNGRLWLPLEHWCDGISCACGANREELLRLIIRTV